MAKGRSKNREDDFGKVRTRRNRGYLRKRYWLLGSFVVLVAAILIGLPIAASNRGLIVSTANKYAGISPIRIDMDSVQVGWFSPLHVRGLRLIDERGADLVKVSEIETELGLWRLATDYMNLRTLTVRGIDVQVDVQPGTTSIEEALRPLIGSSAAPAPSVPTNDSTNPTPLHQEGYVLRRQLSQRGIRST